MLPPRTPRAALLDARASYRAFLERADGKAEYAGAVVRARQRIEDIDLTLIFLDGEAKGTPH
jgi:hypothetical protein